jgi:hypothetical protein
MSTYMPSVCVFLQAGSLPGYFDRMRQDAIANRDDYRRMDRYDHIFGVWRTSGRNSNGGSQQWRPADLHTCLTGSAGPVVHIPNLLPRKQEEHPSIPWSSLCLCLSGVPCLIRVRMSF